MISIVICTFMIGYIDPHTGLPSSYTQPCAKCHECSDLVAAFLESGPPEWLSGQTTAPMCLRREEEGRPA